MTTPRRLRLLVILGILAIGGLALLTTTQPWWRVELATRSISVPGTTAASALSALALASLALAGALSIAGPVFGVILGLLEAFIGVTIIVSSAFTLARPEAASANLISKATGVAGTKSVTALIRSIEIAPWGYLAIASGVLAIVAGLVLLLTFRRWPAASRKYQGVRMVSSNGPVDENDAVVEWDALSHGEDPTQSR